MKAKELRELSNYELETKIRDDKKALFDMRLKQSMGTLDKPTEMKNLRKEIARAKTILNERKEAKDGE